MKKVTMFMEKVKQYLSKVLKKLLHLIMTALLLLVKAIWWVLNLEVPLWLLILIESIIDYAMEK